MDYLAGQIRAIAIALEAEVAEAIVVRAPHKLNRARAKRDQLPMLDHHVISLANRRRVAQLEEEYRDGEKRRSPRLHFVRGHWRHYSAHKIWIAWTYRGDPDLGFIDKDYKL